MPAISAKAPAKIILFGEHAVVYGKPAIAVPVRQLSVKAIIKPAPGAKNQAVRIKSPLVNLDTRLDELPEDHPIAAIICATLDYLEVESMPACSIRISSSIPVAGGLGSGAAVSVAVARGITGFLGRTLSDLEFSELAYGVETIHHGTPSGIDNSVIAFNKPIYFLRGKPLEFPTPAEDLRIIIADTGVPSPTVETVGRVRQRWQDKPEVYNSIFDNILAVTRQAREAIERGDTKTLGMLMDQNQVLLQEMGVSSPELELLIKAAREAGALGAKLSGGGGGGNVIALVSDELIEPLIETLEAAGATRVFSTTISRS